MIFEMTSPSDLPRFEAPPVIETVLGVYFRPLRQMNTVEQGIFWNEALRGDFPEYELRPPVEEALDRFDGRPLVQGLRWQLSNEPETPRLWAKSPTGEHILQVQRNAILANWLRQGSAYRPFIERLATFQARLEQLETYALRKDFQQSLSPTSCTVTYINQIPLEPKESWASALERVLICFSNPANDLLPRVDRARLEFSFAFPSERGRLHVVATPGHGKDGRDSVLQLELSSRATLATEEPSLEKAIGMVRTAHDWIVRGFATLTRPEMHRVWRRVQ
jgi:uncharacterized protein (TIGR04255 family)